MILKKIISSKSLCNNSPALNKLLVLEETLTVILNPSSKRKVILLIGIKMPEQALKTFCKAEDREDSL